MYTSYPGGQCFNPTTGQPTGAYGCMSPSTGVACYSYAGASAPPTPTNAAPDCPGAAYNPYAAQQPYSPYGSGAAPQYDPDTSAYDPNTGESVTGAPDYSQQGPPDDSGFGPQDIGPASQADNSQQDEQTQLVDASGGGGFDPTGNSGITAGGQSDSGDDGSDDGGSDSGDDGSGDDTETPDDSTDTSSMNAPSQPTHHKKHKKQKYYNMETDSGGDASDDSDSGEASDDDSDLDTGINGDPALEDQWRGDNDMNEDEAGTARGTVLSPPIEGLDLASVAKPAVIIGIGYLLWKTVGKKLFKRKRA